MKRLLIFLLSAIAVSCSSQNCKTLPQNFTSYYAAINIIENSSFKIEETANTSNSSWITSAKYYSCDGISGYFIYTTTNKKYIHEDVPIEIWQGFKNADSKGSYYDHFIRGNYRIKIK